MTRPACLCARSSRHPSTWLRVTDCTPAWPCANDTDILIHPYVFRVVCGNGAIMAQAVQTRHIARDSASPFSIEAEVRQAIRCCCEPEAFTFAADQMRTAKQSQADMLINMSAFLGTHRIPGEIASRILRQYFEMEERSAYGFMNAVTAVARDTKDPETKWRLESLGGAIPTQANPPSSPRPSRRERLIPVEAT